MHTDRKKLLQIISASAFFILSGCMTVAVKPDFPTEDFLNPECAYELFLQGDYKNASEQFDIIRMVSEKRQHRGEALYGLACSRMMLAENTEQFRKTLEIWQRWEMFYGNSSLETELLMLRPLLEKIAIGEFPPDFCSEQEEPEAADEKQPEPSGIPNHFHDNPEYRETSPSDRIATPSASEIILKKKIQQKDRDIRNLKENIRKMGKEMDMLRLQLNSLEDIHQEIYEKKKDMVSP